MPSRKRPALQLSHAFAPAPLHVAQVAEHAAHTVLAAGAHAAASYVPGAHAAQAAHVVPKSQRPTSQLVQAFAPAPLHVAQAALQALQTVSAVALHAVLGYVPAPHALHGLHTVFDVVVHAAERQVPAPQVLHVEHVVPLSQRPALQLAQALAPAPVQVAQLAAHAAQTVLDVAPHAVCTYWLAAQALHGAHVPPLSHRPALQVVHWFAAGPEQVAHVGSHAGAGRSATMSGTSSTLTNV